MIEYYLVVKLMGFSDLLKGISQAGFIAVANRNVSKEGLIIFQFD
jgi:hypothetical protein